MRVLVTGSAGFVGRALASKLRNDGHAVIALVRDRTRPLVGDAVVYGDVKDGDLCRRVIADYQIDSVYHLAAQSIVSTCAEDPIAALDIATMGTARLLDAVRQAARPIKVCVSTSDKVYGAAPSPYSEGTPLDARHSYEVSKACQDLVSRMFYSNYGVDVRVVRAVNIYGPGDPNDSRLIPQTVQRVLRGEPPLVHAGASEMRRQYVYIDDVVAAFRCAMEMGGAGEAYCVGSLDEPISVREVIDYIVQHAGAKATNAEIRERDGRFREIQAQAVSDDKIRALGWVPKVPFAAGIAHTIAWYLQRGEVG